MVNFFIPHFLLQQKSDARSYINILFSLDQVCKELCESGLVKLVLPYASQKDSKELQQSAATLLQLLVVEEGSEERNRKFLYLSSTSSSNSINNNIDAEEENGEASTADQEVPAEKKAMPKSKVEDAFMQIVANLKSDDMRTQFNAIKILWSYARMKQHEIT